MAEQLPDRPRIVGVDFRIDHIQAVNPVRGGAHQGVDLGEPLWRARIDTKLLDYELAGEFDALFARLRGVLRTLYVYNPARQRPIAFRKVEDNPDARIGVTTRRIGVTDRRIGISEHPWGSPRVVGVDRAGSRLLLKGFVAGIHIKPGDLGHWDDGPARRLHMSVESRLADSQGEMSLAIWPPPPIAAALPANGTRFEMVRASAEMAIVAKDLPFDTSGKWTAQFEAIQVLRRY